MIGNDLKEYPATHSMSTSWFFADEEGNVAVFDFEDNGPSPWTIGGSCIESLVMDDFAEKDETGLSHFPLNKEQKELVMAFLGPPQEDICFSIVQIDTTKEKDFLSLFPNKRYENDLVCLSKEDGLFAVDYLEKKELADIWKQKMVVKMANWDLFFPRCIEEDCLYGGEVSPFYLFEEAYDISELIKRMNVPVHPFNLSQLPSHLQYKVFRLPLKFSECEKLQIADYFPFTGGEYDAVRLLGFALHRLPSTSGNFRHYSNDLFPIICNHQDNEGFHPLCYVSEPTIIYICAETLMGYLKENDKGTIAFLRHHSATISTNITNVIPSPLIKLKEKGIPIPESVAAHVSDKAGYLEQAFDYVHPRVVIIFEDALPKLRQWETDTHEFSMDANHIRINGCNYPYFLWNDVENNIKEIRELASLPYRGRKRCVLSEEEFKVWQKLNELCKE
ncbi:MAG: hypothetical protein MJZ70_06565 [Bacteroidales bacterium]|nr:hypothetical protein [Bacteroidales bacterium]